MAKISAKNCKILVDDSGGTARDISKDCTSFDIPLAYDEQDVAGFSEAAHNVVAGQLAVPITINGNFNAQATTGAYTVLKGIVGSTTSKTVTIQIGQGAAPQAGDPEFEGEYTLLTLGVSAGDPSGVLTFAANFNVATGASAPAWGTV